MSVEKKAIVGVKMANHKIIPVFSGEENAGHAVFTTVADNQKKAIFSFYYMDNGIDDWQPAGSMAIDGIPPAPAGQPDIDMYIRFTDSGNIVSEIGDPGSGVYKSYQIKRDKSPQNEKEPVLKEPTLELRTAQSDISFNAGHDGIPVSEKARGKKNGKKKRHALLVILVIVILITGVFIAAGLEVPELVKTRIEKIIPEIRSPLWGLIKPGHKKGLKSDSAGNTSELGRNTPVASGSISDAAMSTSISVEGISGSAMRASASAEGVSESISKEEGKSSAAAANKENTQPVRYRITWGDTLWKIAKRFYGEPRLFPSIAQKNSISNPDRIIAGDTLQIPSQAGDGVRIDKKDENVSK